jgi:hypothetical protein
MARQILFDELRVTVYVPSALCERDLGKIRMALAKDSLRASLRRAVRDFVLRNPKLKPVRITVTG